jgi:hypothetical protein
LTPLYHGVALTRSLALGTVTDDPVATIIHLVYLVTLATVGAYLTTRTIERRLIRG